MNDIQTRTSGGAAFPANTRWLSIAAGCFAGAVGALAFGWVFPAMALVLVCGAIAQPYTPRVGKWLVWVGAAILTVNVGLFLLPQALGSMLVLARTPDTNLLLFFLADVVSVVLMVWCDVALVVEDRKTKAVSSAT